MGGKYDSQDHTGSDAAYSEKDVVEKDVIDYLFGPLNSAASRSHIITVSTFFRDISYALNPNNPDMTGYVKGISSELEKLIRYDFSNLEDDISSGKLPLRQIRFYKAMSRFSKHETFGYSMGLLSGLIVYFSSVNGDGLSLRQVLRYKESLEALSSHLRLAEIQAKKDHYEKNPCEKDSDDAVQEDDDAKKVIKKIKNTEEGLQQRVLSTV